MLCAGRRRRRAGHRRLRESDNRAAVENIREAGGRAYAFEAELSDPEACRRVTTEVLAQFGRLDGLVNNAGANDGVGL